MNEMYVDASAIVAILNNEPEKALLLHKLETAQTSPYVSAVTFLEAVLSYARTAREDDNDPVTEEMMVAARNDVTNLLKSINAKNAAIMEKTGETAYHYSLKYGRGRHPAKLNMGDCLAAACASEYRLPLLYKGNDFSQTDLT